MTNPIVKGKFRTPVDQDAVAVDWVERGYSFHPFNDPPGQEWNGFVHATNEVVTVAEGRLEVTIEDTVLVAEPGDEVFIPKNVVHSVRNIHDGTTRWCFGYD